MHRTGFDSIQEFVIWIESLPPSKMVYPKTFFQNVKYVIWKYYTPLHPSVRDFGLRFGFVRHQGRQDFVLGKLSPSHSMKDFVSLLVSKGYGNHFVAWKDDDEVVSFRLVEDFEYQYHVRLYKDGEVRGHYEFTPECYPYRHMQEYVLEERRDYFRALFGDSVVSTV